jgi:hypothetical protein
MRSSKSTGNSVDPSAAALITLRRQLHIHLHPSLERLRGVRSAITTAALALRQQNADADVDVAHVLLRSAADPLDAEIERLELLFNAFERGAPREPLPLVRWRQENDRSLWLKSGQSGWVCCAR